MTSNSMVLKVVLPFELLFEKEEVIRLVVETTKGSMGLLPLRLDCVAFLVPGIIMYEAKGEAERYVVAAEGILVKTGPFVTISVQNGIIGADLGDLQKMAQQEFLKRESGEQEIKRTVGKLESAFLSRVIEGVICG